MTTLQLSLLPGHHTTADYPRVSSPYLQSGRHPLDFYESPSWFTTEVLRYVNIFGVVGEPCVGHGAIASLLPYWKNIRSIWTNDLDPNNWSLD